MVQPNLTQSHVLSEDEKLRNGHYGCSMQLGELIKNDEKAEKYQQLLGVTPMASEEGTQTIGHKANLTS